ncbi:bifunctional hydroxymethylpyrimidine kinase/phosphomethylpyrimidine kinase [Shigella flexneri]
MAQNTRGVQSVYRIEPDFVAASSIRCSAMCESIPLRIGMLAETNIVEAVAEQ